jgi:hypothetical protein
VNPEGAVITELVDPSFPRDELTRDEKWNAAERRHLQKGRESAVSPEEMHLRRLATTHRETPEGKRSQLWFALLKGHTQAGNSPANFGD